MRFLNWLRWLFRPRGMNHYCRGESGSGEWSCRSDVPSICYYCREPNAALISERAAGVALKPLDEEPPKSLNDPSSAPREETL